MIDKAVNFNLHNIKGPVMHGHTKIELYNPKTRIKNVVESENTFQGDVLARYTKSLGEARVAAYMRDNYLSQYQSRWKYFVGGLFLFRDPITAPALNMPATNKMVGNGVVDFANNTECPELGSFNSAESSASASAITQVYDFATNQANGTIGCVCLTSKNAAMCGYGNDSGIIGPSDWKFNQGIGSSEGTYAATDVQNYVYYNNTLFVFDASQIAQNKLILHKKRVMIESGSVFSGLDLPDVVFDLSVIGKGNMEFNAAFQAYHMFYVGDGKFRFTTQSDVNVPAGGTFNYYEYDANNDTLTLKSMTNSASVAITEGSKTGFYKGNIMLTSRVASPYNTEMFDLSTGIYIKTLDQYYSELRQKSINFTDEIIYIYDYSNNAKNKLIFPDGTEKVLNCSYNTSEFMRSLENGIIQINHSQFNMNPMYLATINNLQSAVTKSPSQTMKVTYTLSQA